MGRKGKKSKKQLEEELAKAADEQKRHEEKERLYQMEQDVLRKQAERLAEELDSKEKVLEVERLDEEQSIVTRMKTERKQNLEYEQSKLQERIKWQKFVACSPRPNVAFESEITTYMTMLQEERSDKMEDAMRKCEESEGIVEDLQELFCRAQEEGDVARQEWCKKYIREIRDLEIAKIDEATGYLLQYIERQEANTQSQVNLPFGQQDDDVKVGFWGHLQSKGFRAKQIDFPRIGIGLEMPKSIALQAMGHSIGVRALYTSYDSSNDKDPSEMSIGGMIRVDLLSIPPFSKKVKGWTIRQVPPPGEELVRLPYPNHEHATTAAITVQPCKIEYKVSSRVLVGKAPTISWWDPQEERWSQEGITEISWETETRKVSFWSARLAAFSITQRRYLDLPYKHWSMRPLAPLLVDLHIQAARYELHFVISEDGLRLKGPDEPELHDVMFATPEDSHRPDANGTVLESTINYGHSTRVTRVRSPAALLKELRDCGLNLMPTDQDAEYLDGYTPKCSETEARAYSDLSEIAGFYDITSSIHNKNLPPERAMVRVRENPLCEEFDPLDPDCDTDYQAILFFPDKSCFVKSFEEKNPCDESLLPGHYTHASLYLCYDKVPKPGPTHADDLQRLEVTCATARFVEAVRQTMQIMRLLSFV
eukprot:CAMPEP_0206426960 /NCGR_PEP_ID=MMETSP0324_2-20121206/4731_1 /ASSEMBLY_ACC=CAM_ASM_000836 /TAXON_ID=2866 /ORGANISM="Crypthecodinium cohnii, Strain Seligo" /LENGTH=650 /DNA_ID=CAMNT_0053892099 /DNA_START=12 /DNA_END=1964 /DNA_ORIENTATION=+